jgi:hypothetical protein
MTSLGVLHTEPILLLSLMVRHHRSLIVHDDMLEALTSERDDEGIPEVPQLMTA